MTKGSIVKHIILFSLPILVGSLFQQLYNTVDAWVVGNYVSNEAFSAVGTVSPIINALIGFFLGLASGTSVVISQFYGAKDDKNVERVVHTASLLTIILGVVFTFLGIALVPAMLKITNTPDNVFPESRTYLTIYFAGIIGLMIYNMGAGILRAIGDSKKPFYYLVASAVINTVLDLVFVLCFKMGVDGVAYATIIAQGISALLVIVELLKTTTCVKLIPKNLRICRDSLTQIIRVGFPSGIQMAITSFSNVFVQSYINYFQADCMSGWTAYTKVDPFVLLPMQAFSTAATTFVGQNLGCGEVKRAKRGANITLVMALVSTGILVLPMVFAAPQIVAFFNDKKEVIEYGTIFLRYLSPFYILCCLNQVYAGALRGAGNGKAPMIIMLSSFVVFRQIYLFVMSHYIANEIIPISMSYPAGWLVCSVAMTIYYFKTDISKTKITK